MPVPEMNFLQAAEDELGRLNDRGAFDEIWQAINLANHFDIQPSANGQVSRKEVGRVSEVLGIPCEGKECLGNRIYDAAARLG
ncbi:MAG: hypothetical protein H6860_02755 [Rhodospirillales bacterium]|nr:hypothetical protein [Rhodospirillales bacterium]